MRQPDQVAYRCPFAALCANASGSRTRKMRTRKRKRMVMMKKKMRRPSQQELKNCTGNLGV